MNVVRWFSNLVQPKAAKYGSASDWGIEHFPSQQCDIAARVADVLVDCLNASLDDLSGTTRFIKDLRMDDFESMEVLTALEAKFQISISEADAQNLETVSDLVRYLCKQYQPRNT